MDAGLFIIVENQLGYSHDIELYIERSFSGRNAALMDIRETLLRKADGIFLWVVLSVSLLKPLCRRGRVQEMKDELETIPSGLHDLFSAIMTKNTKGIDECITLLRWMLVANRKLSAIELYLAI